MGAVEEHWPHVAELHALLREIASHHTTTNLGDKPAVPEGQDLITAIKQYEISNGTAWRS